MSKSRSRLAADWFAKIRQNATTQEVEHEDVTTVISDASVTTTVDDTDYLLIYDGDTNTQKKISASKVGGGSWATTTANHNAVAREKIFADCSSNAVTVYLPGSPNAGDEVQVVDVAGNSETNSIIVSGNGNNIMGDTSLLIDINHAAVRVAYQGSTHGWRIVSG